MSVSEKCIIYEKCEGSSETTKLSEHAHPEYANKFVEDYYTSDEYKAGHYLKAVLVDGTGNVVGKVYLSPADYDRDSMQNTRAFDYVSDGKVSVVLDDAMEEEWVYGLFEV